MSILSLLPYGSDWHTVDAPVSGSFFPFLFLSFFFSETGFLCVMALLPYPSSLGFSSHNFLRNRRHKGELEGGGVGGRMARGGRGRGRRDWPIRTQPIRTAWLNSAVASGNPGFWGRRCCSRDSNSRRPSGSSRVLL